MDKFSPRDYADLLFVRDMLSNCVKHKADAWCTAGDCCIISRLSEFCIGHFMTYYMPVGLINGHFVCYYMMYCAGPRASKPCWLSTLNYRVCSICLSFLCIVYNTKLQHGDPDVRITLLRYFQAITKQQKGTSALF